jgi:tetratricopeptide (TPR) repeat protein
VNQGRDVWREAAQAGEADVTAIENARTRIWLGHLYSELEERDKALDQTKRALAIEPDNAWVLYEAGEINARLGRDREAIEYPRQAVAHGFLELQYFDYLTDHLLSDRRLRDDPESRRQLHHQRQLRLSSRAQRSAKKSKRVESAILSRDSRHDFPMSSFGRASTIRH